MTTTTSTQTSSEKGRVRTMGVSRDYTTGNDGYTPGVSRVRRTAPDSLGSTALLTRPGSLAGDTKEHRAARIAAQPAAKPGIRAPRRTEIEVRPRNRKQSNRSRLGSQQVVSKRGRRVTTSRQVTLFTKLSAYSIALLIGGVCLAMWLSGVATSQTFTIQQLTNQESTLVNQLETLNRDLENARSAADVSRRAVGKSMGVPVQAGIVEVKPDGGITTLRPAKPELDSIIDVNGAPVRPGQASSDPKSAANVQTFGEPLSQAQPGTELSPAGQPAAAPVVHGPARAPYSR